MSDIFETGLEVILRGTPEVVLEHMTSIAKQVTSPKGFGYGIRARIGDAPDWARWDKTYRASCVVYVESKVTKWTGALMVGKQGVGKITLLLLPDDRTLFKVEPRSEWSGSFSDDPLDTWAPESSEFMHFLERLFAEFQRLGLVDFEEEKSPLGFRLPHREKDG